MSNQAFLNMEDKIVIDEANFNLDDHSGEEMKSERLQGKSSSQTGELLQRIRDFQRRKGDNQAQNPCTAYSTWGRADSSTGLEGTSLNKVSFSGKVSTRNSKNTAEKIISRLELKVRTIMESVKGHYVDIVQLVRRDTDSKYSREDVKRITQRLVRKIAGDAVVGRIVDEAIKDIESGSEYKVQPEGWPKDWPRPPEEEKGQERSVHRSRLGVELESSAGSSRGKGLDKTQ